MKWRLEGAKHLFWPRNIYSHPLTLTNWKNPKTSTNSENGREIVLSQGILELWFPLYSEAYIIGHLYFWWFTEILAEIGVC